MVMCFEDLLVVSFCLLSSVARLKECRTLYHAVVEPLVPSSAEKCVVKEIQLVHVVSGAAARPNGGSGILQESRQYRDFDPTRGYAGQDITTTGSRC